MSNKWGIVAAAWGDVLCSLAAVKAEGVRKVVYFGKMQGMDEFLASQDFIDRVISINYEEYGMTHLDYHRIWDHLCTYHGNTAHILEKLFQITNIPLNAHSVVNCCMDPFANHRPVFQISDLKLPESTLLWAAQQKQILGDYVLLCPYSYNSTNKKGHWEHWETYLHWLFVSYPETNFLFCGTDEDGSDFQSYPNFINFYRKTPTAAHMYALANLSSGVITTANGLCHWLNSMRIPSLVMLNHPAMREFDFYKRILDERWLHLLSASISLEMAQTATEAYLSAAIPQRFADQKAIFERDSRRLVDIFAKMPCFTRDFLGEQASCYEPHYEMIRDIANVVGADSLLQIGCEDRGAGILSAMVGHSSMKAVRWSGEYKDTYQNLTRYADYYLGATRPQIRYCLASDLQSQSGNRLVIVSGSNDYAQRRAQINQALNSDADLVLCTDYFAHSQARAAARDCSKDHKRLLRLIHTEKGMALWDKTASQRYGRDFDNKGITQLLR